MTFVPGPFLFFEKKIKRNSWSNRQEDDRVADFIHCNCLNDEMKIGDDLPKGNAKLVGIDNAGEMATCVVPLVGQDKEVVVLGEDDTFQIAGTRKQVFILCICTAVFKCR